MSFGNDSRVIAPAQNGRIGYKVVVRDGAGYRGLFSGHSYQSIGVRGQARTAVWHDAEDARNYFYALDSLEGARSYLEVVEASRPQDAAVVLRVSLDRVTEEGDDNSYTWNYAGEYDQEDWHPTIAHGYSPAPAPLAFRGKWMTILEEVQL